MLNSQHVLLMVILWSLILKVTLEYTDWWTKTTLLLVGNHVMNTLTERFRTWMKNVEAATMIIKSKEREKESQLFWYKEEL